MNFGWDSHGFARRTGVPEIDNALGAGELQDAQDLNLHGCLVEVVRGLGVDMNHGPADQQVTAGRVWLASGAILERGHSWRSVWACTRLPDAVRPGCNGSCQCCAGHQGWCETGAVSCPEHCPIGMKEAGRLGMLAERPVAG
jgi:hypothetical protein